MDLSSLSSIGIITELEPYRNAAAAVSDKSKTTGAESFESLFRSALGMVKETNTLTNQAQEETINFAMGYTDNMHDLLTAQWKANISLQYTAAVRNSVMQAYKEIMNLQF